MVCMVFGAEGARAAAQPACRSPAIARRNHLPPSTRQPHPRPHPPGPQVLLWDPRRPQSPYAAATPDGAPALRLAPSPFGDCLAVSTNRGLHAVDLIDGSASTQPIAPFPLPRPYSDIAWNAGTGELYAAMHSGAVAVFGRR